MTITLKYFGLITEITHLKEEILSIDQDAISVSSLKSKIESVYQDMENLLYSIAVNQSMEGMDYVIQDQDVIAFLPPFAGG